MIEISAEKLFEFGAHFGHQSGRLNPKMKDYIFTNQDGMCVFDLIKTKRMLEEALVFLAKLAAENKNIIFVGTKKQVKDKVKEVAQATGAYFLNERWPGGFLTNFGQIEKSLQKLADLKEKRAKGELNIYTKKERLILDREISRLERLFGGVEGLKGLPDALVVVDIRKEKTAVEEALKTKVPVVAMVDSNSDPTLVDYPIPMNDDSILAVGYVLDLIAEAILAAKKGKKVSFK